MESFKQKEQALLHLNKQALELRKEMEKKSTEQNAYNEQLMESFKQKEQALLVANKQVLEHELGSKDVIIALLNGKIEKQVRYYWAFLSCSFFLLDLFLLIQITHVLSMAFTMLRQTRPSLMAVPVFWYLYPLRWR